MSHLRKRAGKRFSEPFGKAGLTVAILALVMAMVGGAWAATGLNGKQKKEVKAIAKSFQGTGPAGAAGTNGTNGTNGKDGINGKDGTPGTPGKDGTNGAPGEPGKGVLAEPLSVGNEHCAAGGTELEVEESGEPHYACNGDPAKLPPTLPAGVTETGAWAASGNAAGEEAYSPISFPIKLGGTLGEEEVKFITKTQQTAKSVAACQGTYKLPIAASGKLCVYEGSLSGAGIPEIYELGNASNGASPAGAFLFFQSTGVWFATGSWAVTG